MAWEYYHGIASTQEIGPLLNRLGEQGWELVQVLPAPEYFEMDRRTHFEKVQFFLKREKAPRSAGPVREPNRQARGGPHFTEGYSRSST